MNVVVAGNQTDVYGWVELLQVRLENAVLLIEYLLVPFAPRLVDEVSANDDGCRPQSVHCLDGFLHESVGMDEVRRVVIETDLCVGHLDESELLRAGGKHECHRKG